MSVKLTSYENLEFDVPRSIVHQSITIRNMLADIEGIQDPVIPLPNVNGTTLLLVIEYLKLHANDVESALIENNEAIPAADIAFISKTYDVDKSNWDVLFDLILAANYLDIKSLLDVTCKTVANTVKGCTPEQIRKTFKIQGDFTPEEEEQVRKENEWSEE